MVELLCLQNCRSLQKQTYSCKEQFIVSFSLHLCSMICTTNLITFDHRNFIMDMKYFEILNDKKKMTLLFIDFGKVVTIIVIEAWCSGHTPITLSVYICIYFGDSVVCGGGEEVTLWLTHCVITPHVIVLFLPFFSSAAPHFRYSGNKVSPTIPFNLEGLCPHHEQTFAAQYVAQQMQNINSGGNQEQNYPPFYLTLLCLSELHPLSFLFCCYLVSFSNMCRYACSF